MRHASALLLAGVCVGGLAVLCTDRAPSASTSPFSTPASIRGAGSPGAAAGALLEPPGR